MLLAKCGGSQPFFTLEDHSIGKTHGGQDTLRDGIDAERPVTQDARPGPTRVVNGRVIPVTVNY